MRAEDLLPITNMGPLDPLSIIALALIVIIGLPHGAFDGAVALSLGYTRTLQGFVGFIVISRTSSCFIFRNNRNTFRIE
jgi:hypothetical protein